MVIYRTIQDLKTDVFGRITLSLIQVGYIQSVEQGHTENRNTEERTEELKAVIKVPPINKVGDVIMRFEFRSILVLSNYKYQSHP